MSLTRVVGRVVKYAILGSHVMDDVLKRAIDSYAVGRLVKCSIKSRVVDSVVKMCHIFMCCGSCMSLDHVRAI